MADSSCCLQYEVGPLRQRQSNEAQQFSGGADSAPYSPQQLKRGTGIWFVGLLALLVLGFLLAPAGIAAQEFRATISGTITDPSGAVVPGASVEVQETRTGTISRTTSDSDGQYVVPFLLPGDYSIVVTAPGFQKLTRNGITIEAQGHPIINLQLTVGTANQSVTVTGAAPQLNMANASVGSVISTASVADLPLNGRTPTTLAELAPGVITTAAPELIHPFDNNAGNEWSMGGTPNQVSEVLLDGSPDLTLLGALAYAPTEDSVAEVSVRPFDTDASFGHTIGGVINMVTKSGTNHLHGTAYEFGQISGIDANTYFNDRGNEPLPVFHYNQYGLSVGGPVWVPKVFNGRNKLFFFFAWEGLKDSQPATVTDTVPTLTSVAGSPGTGGEVNGDFYQTLVAGCPAGIASNSPATGAVCNPSGKNTSPYPDPNQIYDPFTAQLVGSNVVRSPIYNNQLTSAGPLDTISLALLKLFPAPNTTGSADGQDNYISNAPSVDSYDNEFGRLDYNLSSRDHLFMDARHNYRSQVKEDYFGNGATGATLVRENLGTTVDNVYTINPTTVLDTRLNWTFFNEIHGTPANIYNPSQFGFPNSMSSNSTLLTLPYINFATGSSCGSFTSYQCLGSTGSALDPTTSYQVFVDVMKVLGKHTLKIGFDGRQYRLSVQNFGYSSGGFTFNSNFVTAGTGASAQTFGGDLASFLYGLASSGEYDLNSRADYHQYYVGTFIQDDWRVNDRLTLNMGLRFDIDTPFEERLGKTVDGFNPTAPITYSGTVNFTPQSETVNGQTFSVSSLNTAGGLTFPSGDNGAVYATNNGFFSPRFGFSYGLDSKTVVRGGFGVFVQPETLADLASDGVYSSNALSNQEGFSASTSYVGTNNNYLTPATTINNPFPSGFTQPVGSSQGANTFLGAPAALSFLAPAEHDPYSERWDLGFQRSITNSLMAEALYEGNHALHLPVEAHNINALLLQDLSTTPFRNQNMATAYGKTVNNPFYNTLGTGNTTGLNTSKTEGYSSLLYPFPQFGSGAITEENQTIGQSWFNAVLFHLEQRMRYGLTLTANYSFSKLIERDTYLNDEDPFLTTRISPFDHTHHFTIGGTYDLPFGRGKMFNLGGSKLWDEIAGGYVLNAIYQFQTGAPIYFSADIPLQPGVTLRQITNQPRNTSPEGSGTPALNTAAFVTGNYSSTSCTGVCDGTVNLNGQYYDHYRTLPQTLSWVREDGYNNLDASILKDFHFTEGTYFQLRFETFNTLNHPVFSAPNVSSATSSNFGYITSTTSNSLPRQIQIGGRLVF